jgi:hypothetical protein
MSPEVRELVDRRWAEYGIDLGAARGAVVRPPRLARRPSELTGRNGRR